jgi:hypothetical protein
MTVGLISMIELSAPPPDAYAQYADLAHPFLYERQRVPCWER